MFGCERSVTYTGKGGQFLHWLKTAVQYRNEQIAYFKTKSTPAKALYSRHEMSVVQ